MASSSDAALTVASTSICAALIFARCMYRLVFRCHIHRTCHRKWRIDDFYMTIAILPLIGRAVCILWSFTLNPNHTYDPATEVEAAIWGESVSELDGDRELSFKLLIPARIFYALFLWVLKLGLLAFYSRFIDVFRWGKAVTDAVWWFIILSFIAVLITILAECRPLYLLWALNSDNTKVACNRAVGNLILMAVCSIVINIALIILPFPMLRHLRLNMKEKLQLGFLFSVGAVLVAITILRLPLILNQSVSQKSRSMWASIEILCACIVSNTPFFYAIVKDLQRQHDDRPERSPSNATNPDNFYDLQSLPSSAGAQYLSFNAAHFIGFRRAREPLPRRDIRSLINSNNESNPPNDAESSASTMPNTQHIAQWLDSLPDEYAPAEKPSKTPKRKAQQEPSPPASDSSAMEGTTPKRRRLLDLDRTPRATDLPPPASTAGSSASWSESGDGASRSNSPKKQMLGLRLEERGLECRQLNIDTAPPAVSHLLDTIREIGNGIEILSEDMKTIILESPLVRGQNTRLWRFAFKEEGVADSLPGRLPLPDEISLIYDLARHCHDTSHEEVAWNMEVHYRLLQAILREPNTSTGTAFNFTACTTARAHRRFVPYSSTAKMVDFCLYDSTTSSLALQALGRRTPTLTVNHTDFAPLQLSPIVLSIETKRPGKELDAAQLQMGVWHAAQWAFLRSVIGLTPQPLTAEEEVLRKQKADTALKELGFIPGIIVQGHRWLFVFSTLEGDKTVLWTERQFGTTQSILDTIAGTFHNIPRFLANESIHNKPTNFILRLITYHHARKSVAASRGRYQKPKTGLVDGDDVDIGRTSRRAEKAADEHQTQPRDGSPRTNRRRIPTNPPMTPVSSTLPAGSVSANALDGRS
ncbi:hypothetical protein F53441_8473 [Fusarium austroafricanum]|uniref:Uncharacterized protein n=1 Tax=Fusarium austroafricanum TaxID=2364996 RepID=A0A8H4NXC1_9HYPO|nr:hypothetical protein F53441_8473 [Fusarium austroafricanum]